jgi:prepilin-type N-terminal cleavage/methylation domain-containing protein
MHPSNEKSKERRGFSLVEVLVVLLIVAVAGALLMPNVVRWIEIHRLKTTARQLVADLQFARIKAISEKVQHRLSFDNTKRAYTLEKGNLPVGSTTWTPIGLARVFSEESNPYYARGIGLDDNFASHQIIFAPSGDVSPAGTVTLASPNESRKVIITLAGRARVE